jgi:DNA-binding transcriptional ArsR family regulator
MGSSKTELFSDFQNQLAKMAKALSHPARIAILETLIKNGSCMCGDVVGELPLAQSTVSQHLKSMKDAGIIKGDINGNFQCYCIDEGNCRELMTTISKLFSKMNKCC